ncbi:MAG: RluA family pseudouridine synthase [Clostridia bacterium]|nr:RluA family pseudouridine synthase [Clostridia bacterium]
MKSFKVQKNQKLIKFLQNEYGDSIKYSVILKLLKNKDVKVNGKRVSKDVELFANDLVEVYYDGEKTKTVPLVVYVDENIVVIDKPKKCEYESALNIVKSAYSGAIGVHRLDTNTTGLMVFALNSASENELKKAFKESKIQKKYIAEVYGKFDKKEDILLDYLVKDSNLSKVKIFKEKVPNALTVKTGYKVISESETTSVIEVTLYTGRTHQIRAHFSYYGHFVIGDGKYGKEKINRELGAKTQRLTAVSIIFNFDKNSILNYLNKLEIKLNRNPF